MKEYENWARKQYDYNDEEQEIVKGEKIKCTEEEVRIAIKKINKNKAIGEDRLSMKPIDKKELE